MSLYINDKTTGVTNLISGSERPDAALDKTSKNSIQNKVVAEKIDEIENTINGIKKSVSDGKTLVATAITSKGVATESTDTFDTMAENIGKISGGGVASKSNSTKGTFSNALSSIITTITNAIQEG